MNDDVNGIMSKNVPESLSAKYRESFAFFTLRDRLPIIVTKIIDYLSRSRDDIASLVKQDTTDDVKYIIGELARLKNEMQTDKPMKTIDCPSENAKMWNDYFDYQRECMGTEPTWFSASWLYIECYMYRRIYEAFMQSAYLKEFDYFRHQKEDAFFGSLNAIKQLGSFLKTGLEAIDDSSFDTEHWFNQLLQVALWSNRCDLSLTAGETSIQKENPVAISESLQDNVLVNDSKKMWNLLQSQLNENGNAFKLAIILDNAGFELFSDLCFAHFLIENNLVQFVHFYVKTIPWYVSDTMENDFHWTLNAMKNLEGEDSKTLSALGIKWSALVQQKKWVIEKDDYWTTPFDYADMSKRGARLYEKLSGYNLVVFKGDLNYRKLVGDRNWGHEVSFDTALRGFDPTSLCSLRTLKADVVVGMKPGQAEKMDKEYENWQVTGDFAVIQFHEWHGTL